MEGPPLASAAPTAAALPRVVNRSRERAGGALSLGFVALFLSLMVALPLAAVASASAEDGWSGWWSAVSAPEAVSALKLSVLLSLAAALVNAVLGTVTAWVLVRDDFRGKALVNAVIDLPFALPTIVAGLVLLTLYGPKSPVGISLAYTRWAIFMALLFVTLPFVVRTVQPVLHELDTEMEEAARSLGAREVEVFRRVVLPNILPGILSGLALAFARAVGEIGSVVLISGNNPFRTEVASVFVFNQIHGGNRSGASAVAVVLLLISFGIVIVVGGIRRLATRHERA